jgi:hypothetical protein
LVAVPARAPVVRDPRRRLCHAGQSETKGDELADCPSKRVPWTHRRTPLVRRRAELHRTLGRRRRGMGTLGGRRDRNRLARHAGLSAPLRLVEIAAPRPVPSPFASWRSGDLPASPSAPPLRCPGAVTPRAVALTARFQPRPAPSPAAADPSPAIGLACDASVRRSVGGPPGGPLATARFRRVTFHPYKGRSESPRSPCRPPGSTSPRRDRRAAAGTLAVRVSEACARLPYRRLTDPQGPMRGRRRRGFVRSTQPTSRRALRCRRGNRW